MAVADQIARIQTAKENIKSSLSAKGVDVGDAKLDEYSTFIDAMEVGGGAEEYFETTLSYGTSSSSSINKIIKKIPDNLKISGNRADYLFAGTAITTAPLIDTSQITIMSYMFQECNNLVEVPLYNTSKCTLMRNMFTNCAKLTSIPAFETSLITNYNHMFNGCKLLETVPQLDGSKTTGVNSTFTSCSALVNFGGFKNLGQAYSTSKSANYSDYTLNLSSSSNLTYDSLMNVINNLYDIASLGCNTQKLVLGATNLAKLTEEEIKICTDKGWSIS